MHPLETSNAPSNAAAENFLDCGLLIRLCLNIHISHNPALYINRAIHQPLSAAKLLGEKLRRPVLPSHDRACHDRSARLSRVKLRN